MNQRLNFHSDIKPRLFFFFCVVFLAAAFAPMQAEEILLKTGAVILGRVSKINADCKKYRKIQKHPDRIHSGFYVRPVLEAPEVLFSGFPLRRQN